MCCQGLSRQGSRPSVSARRSPDITMQLQSHCDGSEVPPLTCGMVRSDESGMPGSAGTFSMTVCVSTAITPAAGTPAAQAAR